VPAPYEIGWHERGEECVEARVLYTVTYRGEVRMARSGGRGGIPFTRRGSLLLGRFLVSRLKELWLPLLRRQRCVAEMWA
jgi:hypothetical protein